MSQPQPSEAQLTKCPSPQLVADPTKADDTALQLEKLSVGEWGKCNETKFEALVDWFRKLKAKIG